MMADDRKLPDTQYEDERLSYRWYIDYERADEYDKRPDWQDHIGEEEETVKDDDGVNRRETKFFDVYDPENIWIKAKKVYDLMNIR